MFAKDNDTRKKKGTALIIVMSLLMVCTTLAGTVIILHARRDRSEFKSAERLARMYAVEAGLERLRQEVTSNGGWLGANVGQDKAEWSDGSEEFAVGNYAVTVSVATEADQWYLVTSTATDAVGNTTSITMTAKGSTSFADYARFVSDNDLNIGSYASYGGKVHSNEDIGVKGHHISFFGDVTASDSIWYSSQYNKDTCTFYKSATPGVPEIDLPEAAELKAISETAPLGSTLYDWDDPDYKNAFKAATGVFPGNDLEVDITFKQDKMNVVHTSNGRTWTETGVDIPHQKAIYSPGSVTVRGNISRRLSVLTPNDIYIDGPVRYVDDAGQSQWELRKQSDDSLATFDAGQNTYSTTSSWKDDYKYVESDTWNARKPEVGGEKFNPSLGLVSGDTIRITKDQNNREINAALFTSGDVVRHSMPDKKKNLWIWGAIITTGTNPLSGGFSYRMYAYDPHLMSDPPPGFPGGDGAKFRNWHISNSWEVGL